MDLKYFTEVESNYVPIILTMSSLSRQTAINEFIRKIQEQKISSPKYIFHDKYEEYETLAFHIFAGFYDQAVFEYVFVVDGIRTLVAVKRFERANVVGKSLFGILRNVASGKPRTFDLEVDLFKNVGKLTGGIAYPSPLGKESSNLVDINCKLINSVFLAVFSKYQSSK